jgi:hypothetical protein
MRRLRCSYLYEPLRASISKSCRAASWGRLGGRLLLASFPTTASNSPSFRATGSTSPRGTWTMGLPSPVSKRTVRAAVLHPTRGTHSRAASASSPASEPRPGREDMPHLSQQSARDGDGGPRMMGRADRPPETSTRAPAPRDAAAGLTCLVDGACCTIPGSFWCSAYLVPAPRFRHPRVISKSRRSPRRPSLPTEHWRPP